MARRAIRWLLVGLGAVVTLITTVAVAALLFLDDEDYRRISVYLAERYTGRDVAIEGPVSLDLSLRPELSVSGLSVANPAWATEPQLARIDHLEIQLALWPLLSGTISVPRLLVSDAQFSPEIDADGARSWSFGSGQSGDGARPPRIPAFGEVSLENIRAAYRDAESGRATSVVLAALTMNERDGLNQITGSGNWDDRAYSVAGQFGTLTEALEPSRPFPVDLDLTISGVEMKIAGTVADVTSGAGLDLHASAVSDDLSALRLPLGDRGLLGGRFDGRFAVTGNAGELALTDISLTLADSDGQTATPQRLSLTGAVARIAPGSATVAEGIDLRGDLTASTADLGESLGVALPALGPVEGSFVLQGSSGALQVSELNASVGDVRHLTIAATGGVSHVRLTSDPGVSGVDVRLRASAPTTAAVGVPFGLSLPELGQMAASGHLTGDLQHLALSEIVLHGGSDRSAMQITGQIENILPRPDTPASASFTGAATPWLEGLLGRKLPQLGQMHASGELVSEGGALHLNNVSVTAGNSDTLTLQLASAVGKKGNAFDLDLKARDFAVFGAFLDLPIPALGPFSYSGRLDGSPRMLHLSGTARLGQTEFEEALALDLTGAARAFQAG